MRVIGMEWPAERSACLQDRVRLVRAKAKEGWLEGVCTYGAVSGCGLLRFAALCAEAAVRGRVYHRQRCLKRVRLQ